MKNERKRFL